MSKTQETNQKAARRLLDEAWDASNDKNVEVALQKINEAIQLFPANWYLWASKATFLEDLGKYGECEAAARRSLSLDKSQPLVWIILARMKIHDGDFAKAITAYRRAIALKEDFGTLTMLAAVELETNPTDALRHAERALQLNPEWEEAAEIRARAIEIIEAES